MYMLKSELCSTNTIIIYHCFGVFFFLSVSFFLCGQIQLEELLTIPPQMTDD